MSITFGVRASMVKLAEKGVLRREIGDFRGFYGRLGRSKKGILMDMDGHEMSQKVYSFCDR